MKGSNHTSAIYHTGLDLIQADLLAVRLNTAPSAFSALLDGYWYGTSLFAMVLLQAIAPYTAGICVLLAVSGKSRP